LIRDKIEAVIPGFENYNQRVREDGGFYLPNGVKSRIFNTQSGKAQFSVARLPETTIPAGHWRLTTVRAHDQYNTTLYGLDDAYRGIKQGREIIMMHPDDIADLGLSGGSQVDVMSTYKGVERKVENFTLIPYNIPRGCVAAYFPEANPLVPIHLINPDTHTPVSKNVLVQIIGSTSS